MNTLNVHEIRKKPVDLEFSLSIDDSPSLSDAQKSGLCRFDGGVTGAIHAEAEFDHIRVEGKVHCTIVLECSRCLKEFPLVVDERFTVFYTEDRPGTLLDPELELAEHDLLSAGFTGDEISLVPEISDQVLMQIPMKPLCDERCKGLCPVCGADLNESDCSCDRGGKSLPFAALSRLDVSREKGE